MKKIFSLLTVILLILSFSVTAFAVGDDHIDGGGGDMGSGTSTNSWTPGRDGVRVTIIRDSDKKAVTSPIDFSDETNGDIKIHFGKVTKLQYISGTGLSPKNGNYTSIKPATQMPVIIDSNGKSNMEAIREYFCDKGTIQFIAKKTGFNYDKLISGDYKILLEPIAYFKYEGIMYAMTATESALYDQKFNGHLRSKMQSLSHKNLPLAMFLEVSDLGFLKWNGSTTNAATNSDIISNLGLGIIRFKDVPEEPEGEIEAPDVEYRVNTDVITSVTLTANQEVNPDSPASVTFRISGRNYRVNNIVIPEGDSQVVWVKWRTPSTPQIVPIDISVSGAYTAKTDIVAKIVDLNEFIPPDPLATDTNPDYRIPSIPINSQKTVANWGIWDCDWFPVWVWHSDWQRVSTGCRSSCSDDCSGGHRKWVDRGEYVDEGYWDYDYTAYSASITGRMTLEPDDIVPTADGKNMKSGYGVKTDVSATLSTSAPSGHFTHAQTAFSIFPEFEYNTYLRLLERTSGGRNGKFTFQANEFSTYNRKAHFLPIWFPDSTEYVVYTQVWDAWTPDGMLSVNLDDSVDIDGSMFDDWYTNRE